MLLIGKTPPRFWVISAFDLVKGDKRSRGRHSSCEGILSASFTLKPRSSYKCSACKRWGTSLIIFSAVSLESWSHVSAKCWGREVGGAVSWDPDEASAEEGAEACASPAAAQPSSPAPIEQSNDCSLPRDIAASSQGNRGHLKGNTDVFAPQPLHMEGLDKFLEDNLITE